MVSSNRVRPISDAVVKGLEPIRSVSSLIVRPELGDEFKSARKLSDLESSSTVGLFESWQLKLKAFTRLDPSLVRLLNFLNCFGLLVNYETFPQSPSSKRWSRYSMYLKLLLMTFVLIVSGEVVYDINLRQSKLLAEQKRSTPLLTFVIVAYSWLTLTIPIFCDINLFLIGSRLFRFYSRTTATVCNGMFFGKRTSVDSWYYYILFVLLAITDSMGQVVVLGVWPDAIDPYMRMFITQESYINKFKNVTNATDFNSTTEVPSVFDDGNPVYETHRNRPRITAHLLDFVLGESYAHSNLGVCLKITCLVIQFVHSHALLIIVISLANHFATAINSINNNLDKYDFRRLLKQLIILRDSSEQISLIMSVPFGSVIILVFMRQIALNGVFIQSTMLPFENWAVSIQSFTCSITIFMVFIYCDGLQSASKQTHRLKTELTVINENRGGNQSIYEFLDYLNRLSKSIRITIFNVIAINKNSLVGLFGHILTLTFVTS